MTGSYLHGTAPEEQARLSLLNDLLNDGSMREIALSGGEKIVDFGSGLGQLTRRMARAAGASGRVVGVERSVEQLDLARRLARDAGEESLVDFRHGDVQMPPLEPDEWGTFDIAHARYVLEHVPDPLAVVRTMVRAVRPGGRVVIEDDDHDVFRFWPEPAGAVALWQAYQRTFDRNGNDPIVGRRLVSLLHEAGADPVRNTWIFFGACSGMETFSPFVRNFVGVVAGVRETIVSHGLLGASEFDAAVAAILEWEKRPDAACWFALAWAEGVRR